MTFEDLKRRLSAVSAVTRFHEFVKRTDPRVLISHSLIIGIEAGLLITQGLRMSEVAFDQLPDIADAKVLFWHGNQVVAVIWTAMIVAVTYASAETAIRVMSKWHSESLEMKGIAAALAILNLGMCVLEFYLFHSAIQNLGGSSASVPTWMLGLLMLAVHQMSAFWITKNVIKNLFFEPLKGE